mmetsp:Transcript_3712/g.7218  ORF Transcript_3712/g.7218 Transcript_3712/m.7218 type:complete len:512 (+) Transcript_3712:138-1673(+)|eukprot:CAMPEP_0114252698 /NCGR_PEP_ID=MMETSP0058-20121206/15978_1 /TAXON_ID=36894 /ORGANISM="Pyramimonas parkeae, CCMP726" /LENGTH=511 /DNA_ID=CAMNT_0001366655 /DNA_START=138 /DNA_END=1673 /DNA_ORIENTATION=-
MSSRMISDGLMNEDTLDVAFGGPARAKPNAPPAVVEAQMKALKDICPLQPDDTLLRVLQACNFDAQKAAEAMLDGSFKSMLKQWGTVDNKGRPKGGQPLPTNAFKKGEGHVRKNDQLANQDAGEASDAEAEAAAKQACMNHLSQQLHLMQARRQALERETERARAEEDRCVRELENAAKADRLRALGAASQEVHRLMQAPTRPPPRARAGDGADLQSVRAHFGRLRDLVNQRETQILKDVADAHDRVSQQFGGRHQHIQRCMKTMQSMQMHEVSLSDLDHLHMEIAQFTASFQATLHASSRVHFDPQQTDTIFQLLQIHGAAPPVAHVAMDAAAFPQAQPASEVQAAHHRPHSMPAKGQGKHAVRNLDAEQALRILLNGAGEQAGVATAPWAPKSGPAEVAAEVAGIESSVVTSHDPRNDAESAKATNSVAVSAEHFPEMDPKAPRKPKGKGGSGGPVTLVNIVEGREHSNFTSGQHTQGLPQRAPRAKGTRNRHPSPVVLASSGPGGASV